MINLYFFGKMEVDRISTKENVQFSNQRHKPEFQLKCFSQIPLYRSQCSCWNWSGWPPAIVHLAFELREGLGSGLPASEHQGYPVLGRSAPPSSSAAAGWSAPHDAHWRAPHCRVRTCPTIPKFADFSEPFLQLYVYIFNSERETFNE